MNLYIFFKYLHLVSVITMIACLTAELVLIQPTLVRSQVKRIARVDSIYGLAAVIAVGAGLTLWFGVGKGAEFYRNPLLHLKVGLVIVVGLISIIPTVYFLKQSRGNPDESIQVQPRMKKLVGIQLIILAIVPLLATVMASGLRF